MNLLPENIVNLAAATTDDVPLPVINNNAIMLDVLRLDKIDPVISGNKWFKLQYYLQDALQNGHQQLVTFGGAWSNHIVATACAAHKAGLQCTGIIRGEKPDVLSAALLSAQKWGMRLKFVSRDAYNQKNDPSFIEQLQQEYPGSCIIPEGGSGEKGVQGAAQIWQLVQQEKYTHVICAVGSGTMLLGLAAHALSGQQITGIAVLKGFENWQPDLANAEQMQRVSVLPGYHFGGYAKKTNALIEFMNEWYQATYIPTDFVYTGKLFFAISDLIKKGYFPSDSRLLAIHSGGLQGNASLPSKTLVF